MAKNNVRISSLSRVSSSSSSFTPISPNYKGHMYDARAVVCLALERLLFQFS